METVRATTARERLVPLLAAGTFLIFFQAYMVAPLIPLSAAFGVSPQDIGLIVPAYLLPYGLTTSITRRRADR